MTPWWRNLPQESPDDPVLVKRIPERPQHQCAALGRYGVWGHCSGLPRLKRNREQGRIDYPCQSCRAYSGADEKPVLRRFLWNSPQVRTILPESHRGDTACNSMKLKNFFEWFLSFERQGNTHCERKRNAATSDEPWWRPILGRRPTC